MNVSVVCKGAAEAARAKSKTEKRLMLTLLQINILSLALTSLVVGSVFLFSTANLEAGTLMS